MLYADFYFRMKRRDAICVIGWTMGPVDTAVLVSGDIQLPLSGSLCHRRRDLPAGATGFILRFDLNGTVLDFESTALRMEEPARKVAMPASTSHAEAMIKAAPDEVICCLLMGMAERTFVIEDAAAMTLLHTRAKAMAANWGFSELPGAAVAQDQAFMFEAPTRVVVSGWMGDDGSQMAPIRRLGLVLDAQSAHPMTVHGDCLMRPDLSGVQMRALRVGAASGYAGLARLSGPLGAAPISAVGLVQDGIAICTLRPFQPQAMPELGRHYDSLRRNMVSPDRADAILSPMFPSLPPHETAAPAEAPAREGLALVVEHDLDQWLSRDLVRLVRRGAPEASLLRLVSQGTTEGLIRAAHADAVEAGLDAHGLQVVPLTTNAPLAQWAPQARHLIFGGAALLFQTEPFADLAAAREEGVDAWCLVLDDRMTPGRVAASAAEGIEALSQGAPFVAQIDQAGFDLRALPESLGLSQGGQMRWLMIAMARAGRVRFVAQSGLGYLAGRDPVPLHNRLIEMKAMRQAVEVEA